MPTYQNTLIALRGALWRMIDSIDPFHRVVVRPVHKGGRS